MDKLVHFEIPADLERARKFYKGVCGWKMDAIPEMEYILIGTTPVDEKGNPHETCEAEKKLSITTFNISCNNLFLR